MKNKFVVFSLTLIAGIFLGWLIFHSGGASEKVSDHSVAEVRKTIWTCSMHPQIRVEEPGKCPLCGMDLITLAEAETSSIDPDAVHISNEAAALANVLTTVVTKQKPVKEIRLYGKVQADERSVQSQVAHISGRIERLYVNFTGEEVSKDQLLARIYSPELVNSQQELLEAAKSGKSQPGIYEAAREKLRLWKLTDSQISAIEQSGVPQTSLDIVSNTRGVVTLKGVNTGDYVSQGEVLFQIADLSKVWVLFDAYERDIQFLKAGEKISFTFRAIPGENFEGLISFIDPFIDPVTRVAKVRVEAANVSGKLKPEMFASGLVKSEIRSDKDKFIIPASSVLWTGKRSLVYVKLPSENGPLFKLREIELGPSLGESYIVMDGLEEGEEIVTSGTFYIDAASQLEGKTSMMNSK